MMTRRKMYKKGLSDALQANESFAKKQQEAIEHLRDEVRSGNKKLEEALSALGEDIFGIYDYLSSKEKEALYKLGAPSIDIRDLDEQERRLLLAILYQLADDSKENLTEEQQAFIRSIQHYVAIVNPQTFAEYDTIGNIDSLEVQKVFLQVVLEFMYLQNSDEFSELQEEVLDNFSVNKKQTTQIEFEVSRMFNLVGVKGISEKYGYVPEIETEDDLIFSEDISQDDSYVGIPLDIVCRLKRLDGQFPTKRYIETKDYFVFEEDNSVIKYNKRTNTETICFLNKKFLQTKIGINYNNNSFVYRVEDSENNDLKIALFEYSIKDDCKNLITENVEIIQQLGSNIRLLDDYIVSEFESKSVHHSSSFPFLVFNNSKRYLAFFCIKNESFNIMKDGVGKEIQIVNNKCFSSIGNYAFFFCDNDGYVDKNGASMYKKICIYDMQKKEIFVTNITAEIENDCKECYLNILELNCNDNKLYIANAGQFNTLYIYKADISDLQNIMVEKCAELSNFLRSRSIKMNNNFIIALTNNYDLYMFNMVDEHMKKIAEDCYTYYAEKGFFKDNIKKLPGSFKIIEQWLFYQHRRNDEIYRVNVEYPMTGAKI